MSIVSLLMLNKKIAHNGVDPLHMLLHIGPAGIQMHPKFIVKHSMFVPKVNLCLVF